MNRAHAAQVKNTKIAAAETRRTMAERIITGFHAIEEKVLSAEAAGASFRLFYSKIGPRVKKILAAAEPRGIPCTKTDDSELTRLVQTLPLPLQDHRGIVLLALHNDDEKNIDFDSWLLQLKNLPPDSRLTAVALDSVTDLHNVGAILRSCDQFGVNLALLPERRSVKACTENEIVSRVSAGASAWVPVAVVPNLTRAVCRLKEAGFWVYGADVAGQPVSTIDFPSRSVLVMGSEGAGISKLLAKQCDTAVSIPTCGKIDSLNVSVAAGILLYEMYIRRPCNQTPPAAQPAPCFE